MYDPEQDPELEKEWQKKAAGKKAAMTAQDTDQSTAIKDWFRATYKAPHVSLLINKGFEVKQLGEMMFRENQQKIGRNR